MNNNGNNMPPNENYVLDVRGTLVKFIFHWPLYLIMFFVSLFCAFLYLRYTVPVYSSTGEIYIKNDKNNGNGGQGILEDLDIFGSTKIVENEMELIKSPLILEDVITENKFNIKYFQKGKVLNLELYQNTPIVINILTDSSKVGDYWFKILILGNNNIKISFPQDQKKKTNYQTIYTQFDKPFSVRKDQFSISYFPINNKNDLKEYEIHVDSIAPLVYKKSMEITTTLVNRTGTVFQLTYEDEMPKRSADFVNAVLETYNKYTVRDKNEITLNTIKFIEGRLVSLGDELDVLEKEVEKFKKERGITEIEESSKIILNQAEEVDRQLSQSEIQLSVYNEIEKYLNHPEKGKPFSPIYGGTDPAINSLINRYEETVREKSRLSLTLKDGNPILNEVNDQILNTKKSIREYIEGYRRNAAIQKAGLQKGVNQIDSKISKIPTYEREFINIKRQLNVKEGLYNFLLQRREEASVSYASNIASNKIISPGYIDNDPVRPKRSLIYVFFIFSGIVFCTIYIWIKYSINRNITSKRDIERITEIPVFAEIFKHDVPESFVLNERTVLNEQVLNLRNNLKFLLAGVKHSPAILFTSSMSGEGKTFISSHLGNAFTYNNKKTVLLEFDLRKPKLSKALGISNSVGITNYIVGANSLEQIIKQVPGNNNLFIIPSGPIPPNPIELIESEKMKELFTILRGRFDYIIIDTSPVGMVSDAKSLSPLVDCSLFVVRFNYTQKNKFKEMIDDIDRKIFQKIGIVFNGVDTNTSYGYANYGYNSYGYGNSTMESSRMKLFFKSFKQRLF